MVITFLFPHPSKVPDGGYKIIYQYANLLKRDGHQVNIVYAGTVLWSKKSLFHKMTAILSLYNERLNRHDRIATLKKLKSSYKQIVNDYNAPTLLTELKKRLFLINLRAFDALCNFKNK